MMTCRDVAASVMKEFKQGTIKYVDVTPGTGDADEPGEPAENEFTLDATSRGVKYKYVQNGLAVASDLQVTASVKAKSSNGASVDLHPTQNGFVLIDGVKYKIQEILPKPAAGTTVAFVLIVRK